MDRELLAEREQLVELERALQALEASRAVDALTSVDSRVAILRRQADASADEPARAQRPWQKLSRLRESVRRSSGEIVDERLARISSLLNEIYQRLRPHAKGFSASFWTQQEIGFALGRGVKIISFKYGEDTTGFIGKHQALPRLRRSAEEIAAEIDRLLAADPRTADRLKAAKPIKPFVDSDLDKDVPF